MLADIFITTKDRPEILASSLESFQKCTPRDQYRLTVIFDGGPQSTHATRLADHVIVHRENLGLGPSINQALAHIDALKRWDTDPSPLTVYCQDDCLYTPGWLERLSRKFLQLERPLKLGFASGHDAIEHPTRKDLGDGMLLKDWVRATNLLGRHEYWMSMWPISRIDPETGRERGRPHDGLGSSVDWWFLRNHENSVCRTGRTNLVVPGLVQHLGWDRSTWLDRPLPESEPDKKMMFRATYPSEQAAAGTEVAGE